MGSKSGTLINGSTHRFFVPCRGKVGDTEAVPINGMLATHCLLCARTALKVNSMPFPGAMVLHLFSNRLTFASVQQVLLLPSHRRIPDSTGRLVLASKREIADRNRQLRFDDGTLGSIALPAPVGHFRSFAHQENRIVNDRFQSTADATR